MSERDAWPRVSDFLGGFYDRAVEEYYLNRGTGIGDWCDALAMGRDEIGSPRWESFNARIRTSPTGKTESFGAYVERYHELITSGHFRSRFERCIDVQEEIYNPRDRYHGHPDQRWLMTDGREAVFDLKTGAVRKAVALQLAFYDLGMPLNKRRRRFSIHLTAEKAVLTEWKDSRDYDNARILARAFHISRDYK